MATIQKRLLPSLPDIKRLIGQYFDQFVGTLNKKVYVANVWQNASDDPTAIVFENTLGTITLDRTSAGVYKLNADGLFTDGKTFLPAFGDGQGTGVTYLPLLAGGALVGYWTILIDDEDSLTLTVVDETFAAAELSTLIGASRLPVHITVYP